jgi:hypothetical protein
MSLANGGAVVISVETPYEYEVLFDHVADYTKSHGPVNLELNHRTWTVSVGTRNARGCTRCGQPLVNLIYSLRRRNFCAACARQQVILSETARRLAIGEPRRPAKRKEGSWLGHSAASPDRPRWPGKLRKTTPT